MGRDLYMGRDFNQRCWNNWVSICKKKEEEGKKKLIYNLASYMNINSKRIIDLKVKTIELLGKKNTA